MCFINGLISFKDIYRWSMRFPVGDDAIHDPSNKARAVPAPVLPLVSRSPLISGCCQICDPTLLDAAWPQVRSNGLKKNKQIRCLIDGVAPLKEEPADVLHLADPLPPNLESVLMHVLLSSYVTFPFYLLCWISSASWAATTLFKKKTPWTTSSACVAVDVLRPSPTAGEYLCGGCRIGSIRVWFGVCWGMRNWT